MIEETYIRKRILTDAIKDIEWVGECVCDKGKVYYEMPKDESKCDTCPKCKGRGIIERPATIKEVLEMGRRFISFKIPWNFSINGGILRIKEKP